MDSRHLKSSEEHLQNLSVTRLLTSKRPAKYLSIKVKVTARVMKGTTHSRKPIRSPRTKAKEFLTKERHMEPLLLKARMREWDQEFAQQAKQLKALSKRLRNKLKNPPG